jgi:tetratricopeptide (TPR) repeat protein
MTTSPFNYDDWDEQISAYLSGKMTEVTRQKFESDMAQIPELKEAVKLDALLKKQGDKQLFTAYIKANWDDLMADTPLKDANKKAVDNTVKHPEKPANNTPLSIKGFLWAFGFVLLSVLGYFIYQNKVKNDKIAQLETLEKESFTHLKFEDTALKGEVFNLYEKRTSETYEQAEKIFMQSDAIKGKNEDKVYGLYRAINALMLQKPKTDFATSILENLLTFDDDAFKLYEVKWYLAKAYLQKKDFTKARELLEKIQNSPEQFTEKPEYPTEAHKILNILNDF